MIRIILTIIMLLFILNPISISNRYLKTINSSNKPITQEDINRKIQIINSFTSLKHGETGFFMIQALPNTRYTITTNYKKGNQVMAVSQWRKTDELGYATFSWVVGADTQPGIYKVLIKGGGSRLRSNYMVLP